MKFVNTIRFFLEYNCSYIDESINSSCPSSPLNTEEYIVISSKLTDGNEEKESDKHNKKKSNSDAGNALVNVNASGRKDANSKCTAQAEPTEGTLLSINQECNINEMDVVMLSSIQEQKSAQQSSQNSDNNCHPPPPTRIIASNASVMRQSTVTYTRITTASTISSGLQANTTVLNRRNISPNMKNQQVMVTTKKLPSEVTQTTAKVSIGNTTISVPLLKPLNSSQHMHPGSSGHCDLQKQTQTATTTTSQPLSSQTQINLSKILTAKQGYKAGHPTIVSLSQLQIKPVSTTKLVQTKVFSKKLPQLQCSVTTNSSNTNASLVTIAVSKSKQNIAITQSGSKKFTHKQDPGGIIQNNTISEDGPSQSDKIVSENLEFTNEQIEKPVSELTMAETNISQKVCSSEIPLKIVSPVNDEITLNKTTASIKKVLNPNVNILPLLTPLSKSFDQQGNSNIYPAVSIIRQSAPQLITTSATTTCVSVSTSASDNIIQADFQNAKATNLSNLCGKLNTSSLISIPKNISLVLSKNNVNQQTKATIMSANTVRNANSTDQKVKKINLTVSSALNVASVCSMNMSQSFNVSNSSIGSSQPHSQDVSPINKSTVISVAVPPPGIITSADQNQITRKTVKVTPYTLSSLGQHLDKRCKSVEGHEQDHRPNVTNVDILPKKRIKHDNTDATADTFESFSKRESGDSLHSFGDVKSIISQDKHHNIELNKSSIIVPKSEESNNVLLKKLLQNSSSSHNINILSTNLSSPSTTSICSHVLSARKVINVRAPSLGLVSSLEAQLARPVIPPVPATTSTPGQTDISKSILQKNNTQEDLLNKVHNETLGSQTDPKTKHLQVISKETSFVSNPTINTLLLDEPHRTNLTVTGQSQELDSINKMNPNICDNNDILNKTQEATLKDNHPKNSNGNEFKDSGNSDGNVSLPNKMHASIRSESSNEQNLSTGTTIHYSVNMDKKEETNTGGLSTLSTSIPITKSITENLENSDRQKNTSKLLKAHKNSLPDASVKSKVSYDNEVRSSNILVNIKLENKTSLNEKSLSPESNELSNTASSLQRTVIVDKDVESRKKEKENTRSNVDCCLVVKSQL
ncbi:unnamed protein product [Ceratitis capitata]|uniref:(Mediterranean fruit fly) hypothetical protein n=1 Tax=Ceratitis capitata TaxID=7213 RepID=A0A811VDF1_CERCA|nr:unnamed protein product [Ceratitis capitata]